MERISIQAAYVSKYSSLQYTESYKHVQQILYIDLIRLKEDVTLGLAFNIDEKLPRDIWQIKCIDIFQFTIKSETP